MLKFIPFILILLMACEKTAVDEIDNSAYDAMDKSFLTLTDFDGLPIEQDDYGWAPLYALRSALSPRMAVNLDKTSRPPDPPVTIEWDENCRDTPPTLADLPLQLISRARWVAHEHRRLDRCTATYSSDSTEVKITFQNADLQVLMSQLCTDGDYTGFEGQKFTDLDSPFFTCDFSLSSVQSRLKFSYEYSMEMDGTKLEPASTRQWSLMMDPEGQDCVYSLDDGGLRAKNCVFADHFALNGRGDSIIWSMGDVLANADRKVIEGRIDLVSYRGWSGRVQVWKDDPIVTYKLTNGTDTIRGDMDFSTSLKSWIHQNLLQRMLQQASP